MRRPRYPVLMRVVVGLALAATISVTLLPSASGFTGSSSTSLRVSYWDGPDGPPDSVWTLRCNPAGGTLARPARACRKLAAGGAKLFATTPPNVACTEIYGGPQRARIVGTVRGVRVWTMVTRVNGCEITRWQRLSPWLLPPGGAT